MALGLGLRDQRRHFWGGLRGGFAADIWVV